MQTKKFWTDAAERAIRTVAQTLLSLWLVGEQLFNVLTVDWKAAFGVAVGAGVLSLLMSIVAGNTGNHSTAEFINTSSVD